MKSARIEELDGVDTPLVRVGPHPCSYFPDRLASELVVLSGPIDSPQYQSLMDHRFRRSGPIFYRPDCPHCRACVPIRVPVARFIPSKSQRRVLRRNADVAIAAGPPQCDDERFELYNRYQFEIHDGGMTSTRQEFERFSCESPINTLEMTFRLAGRLIGVSLIDMTPVALSSVYFYYDPDHADRSPGVFSGLAEIAECARRGLPYWYIGFHIRGCQRMEYKDRFAPCEYLHADGAWRETYPPIGIEA